MIARFKFIIITIITIIIIRIAGNLNEFVFNTYVSCQHLSLLQGDTLHYRLLPRSANTNCSRFVNKLGAVRWRECCETKINLIAAANQSKENVQRSSQSKDKKPA